MSKFKMESHAEDFVLVLRKNDLNICSSFGFDLRFEL